MFERNRIAETLRNAREKQGLSLEQAAAAAGIPTQYVRLLEGETNVKVGVSDELYLIPFFRKYARFVGIDAEEMLPEFVGFVQQLPGEGSPPIRLDYRSRWAGLWKPAAVLVTIAAAVALMLRVGPNRKAPVEEPVESVAAAPATPIATPVPTESPAEAPVANAMPVVAEVRGTPEATVTISATTATMITATMGPAPAITPQGGVAGGRELEIVAKEETWFSMALDDQPTKQYLLRAGESRKWSAGYFTITVGNAGGITLSLDGKELPALGPTGKVVRNIRLPAEPVPTRTP